MAAINPADLLDAAAQLRKVRMRQDMTTVAQLAYEIDTLCEFVQSIPHDRLVPWHTVTVTPATWHMAHPVTCDLAACPFDAKARKWPGPPAPYGTHRWEDPNVAPTQLDCTCTIQPAMNLPEPVDAAHWWDPECPVHLSGPNDG